MRAWIFLPGVAVLGVALGVACGTTIVCEPGAVGCDSGKTSGTGTMCPAGYTPSTIDGVVGCVPESCPNNYMPTTIDGVVGCVPDNGTATVGTGITCPLGTTPVTVDGVMGCEATGTVATSAVAGTGGATTTTGNGGSVGGTGGTGGGACNPVTNAGCTAGDVCDVSSGGGASVMGFTCYPPPNPQTICSVCDGSMGPYCVATETCIQVGPGATSACARYCCIDADCGPGGTCNAPGMPFGPAAPTVGYCVTVSDGGGATVALACDPPVTPPSNGSCFP